MERHATDARPQPAGLWLWVTLSCCPRTPTCATQPQLGFKTWFQVIHAATNETEVETTGHVVSIRVSAAGEAIGAALRRIAASCPVAKWVMFAGLLILAAGAVGGSAAARPLSFVEQARSVVQKAGEIYGPPLVETFTRYEVGKTVFTEEAVPLAPRR